MYSVPQKSTVDTTHTAHVANVKWFPVMLTSSVQSVMLTSSVQSVMSPALRYEVAFPLDLLTPVTPTPLTSLAYSPSNIAVPCMTLNILPFLSSRSSLAASGEKAIHPSKDVLG